MTYARILAVGLALLSLPQSFAGMRPEGCRAETYSGGPRPVGVRRYKRPLEVTIYARRRRIGGYSYSASDVVNTYQTSPPPYAHVRQTPSGPFDSGFFFDSGIGPRGGDSPYQR